MMKPSGWRKMFQAQKVLWSVTISFSRSEPESITTLTIASPIGSS